MALCSGGVRMNLSSGDWVAVAVGLGASMRWVVDIVKSWVGDRRHEDREDERALATLRSDFDIHVSEDRLTFSWLKETLERIERNIGALQRQISSVATHQPARIYEIGQARVEEK